MRCGNNFAISFVIMDDSRKMLFLGLVLSGAITCSLGFTIPIAPARLSPSFFLKQIVVGQNYVPLMAIKKYPISEEGENEDEDDENSFEYARVRRGRGRGRFSNDNAEFEESKSTRASSGETDNYRGNRKTYDSEYDEINFDRGEDSYDDEDEYLYEDDEEEDEDYDDDEFDGIIPNPLLDQIDPDGAIERLPELFSDKKFWKDSTIWFFLGFLYLLNRFNNPMLNGIVDLDKVDFSQFYNTVNP